MSDDVADTVRRLGIKGQEGIKQVRRMIRRLRDRHHASAVLFLDPKTGEPSTAAAKWMRQLAADNYVNSGAYHQDPREHAYREGRRTLALEIIRSARLDADRLEALVELERTMK